MPLALPAADDVVAFVELRQQRGDLGRVVLQVAVDRDDAFAFGGVKTGAEGGRLAEIATKADAEDSRIVSGQFADRSPGAVSRAVVDDDDLQLVAVQFRGLIQLAHQLRQVFGFVEDGDDDREHVVFAVEVLSRERWVASFFAEACAAIYRITHTASSDTSQTSRMSTAATSALAGPQLSARSWTNARSRTPRPPGSIDTNPATTANATAATNIGRSLIGSRSSTPIAQAWPTDSSPGTASRRSRPTNLREAAAD